MALISSVLGCAPAFADAPRASRGGPPGLPFTHVAIGDPISKLESHFLGFEQGEPACQNDSGIAGHLSCQYGGTRAAAEIGWFANVPYKILAFDYLHERLAGFRIWIEVANYSALYADLKRLYGAPRSEDSSIVYDRRARPLDQIVSMWKTSSGILELDKRSWSVEQSQLSLITVAGVTEIITNGQSPSGGASVGNATTTQGDNVGGNQGGVGTQGDTQGGFSGHPSPGSSR